MGSPEPRSFSRGKRGIAGSLVFTVFDRDALIAEFTKRKERTGLQKFKANASTDGTGYTPFYSIDQWDAMMTAGDINGEGVTVSRTDEIITNDADIAYADEILPFDITVTFANEYGQRAVVKIYGVELLNEGSGYSIDTVSAEKAYTFIARRIEYMRSDRDSELESNQSHKTHDAGNVQI